MIDRETDVVIIGAGPAGLSVALGLLARKSACRISIVEAGRHFRKRFCPVDHGSTCNGCKAMCNVISGFGGSVHYGDGVKLSFFPSGARLQQHLGQAIALDVMGTALDLLFHDNSAGFNSSDTCPLSGFAVKEYSVTTLTTAQVRTAVERWWQTLQEAPQVNICLDTKVCKIEPCADGIDVFCETRRGERSCVRAHKVFVAVGRKGYRWWNTEVRRLGLAFDKPVISLGLRFECPNRFLAPAAAWHPDLKASNNLNSHKFKTFCFCGSSNVTAGGRIKFTDYGDFTLLDGHVDPDATTGIANFGLLTQMRKRDGTPHDFNWISHNVIRPYKDLRSDRPGKPVLQWYPDFRNKTLSCTSLTDFVVKAGFRPTVTDYGLANVADLLNSDVHEGFCVTFEKLLMLCAPGDKESIESKLRQAGVIGISLEKMWDVMTLDRDMMSSIDNIYVVGDCAGLAQGILQAATSGIAASRGI